MMSEGYVLVAANDHHYLELAVSAACSIRSNDSRPIALLISGGMRVPKIYLGLFDYVVAFDAPPPYDGDFLRRFVLERYTPFDRAMHIDADCLLIRRGIDAFWNQFAGQPFGVMAHLQTSGKCYRDTTDIDEIVANSIAPGVYVTNWGVFYYENSGQNPIMALGRDLITQHIEKKSPVRLTYFSRPGQLSDEPIWGIALAISGINVLKFDYTNALQVTSPSTSDHLFDYQNNSFSVKKGGISGATGQFFHYAAMDPLGSYLEGVAYYRGNRGIPLPSIKKPDGCTIAGEDWAERIDQVVPELFDGQRKAFRFLQP